MTSQENFNAIYVVLDNKTKSIWNNDLLTPNFKFILTGEVMKIYYVIKKYENAKISFLGFDLHKIITNLIWELRFNDFSSEINSGLDEEICSIREEILKIWNTDNKQ